MQNIIKKKTVAEEKKGTYYNKTVLEIEQKVLKLYYLRKN